VGEAPFDELHGSFERDVRSDEQVDMIGHDNKGMELVVTFAAIVLEGFEEEFGSFTLLE